MSATDSTTEEASTTTVDPCLGAIDSYPAMAGNPILTSTASGTTGYFDCQVQSAVNEQGTPKYTMTLQAGNTVIEQKTLTNQFTHRLLVSDLTQAQRDAVLENGLTCSVTCSNPERCGNAESPALTDSISSFTPQVQRPDSSTLYEGSDAAQVQVSFGSTQTSSRRKRSVEDITQDLYCLLKYNGVCSVTIQARTVQDLPNKCIAGADVPALVVRSVTSTGGNTCGGDLSASPSVTLELRAVSDGVVRADRTVTIDVMQVDTVNGQTNETVLDKFDITVKSIEVKGLCKVVGDPHIFTFDQTKYDNMLTGEFLLYEHTELAVEVHGYFYQTGKGSSVCGYAARIGNDVVKVSKCETRSASIHPVTVTLYLVGDLTPQVKVYQEDDGDTVKVYLPSGTLLEMRSSVEASMNLYLRPSAIDFGKTRGLCGVFNNNATGDLLGKDGTVYTVADATDEPDTFSNTYRVSKTDSIYEGATGAIDISSETYCSCDINGESVCAEFGDVAACSVSLTGTDITSILVTDTVFEQGQTTQQAVGRKKRQADGGFTYTVPTVQTNPTWPTASGINEASANSTCTTGITNIDGYATCLAFNAVDFETEISNCMGDILRTGSAAWAASTISSVKASCKNWLMTNENVWADNADGQPTIAQTDVLCTNDCNGQGTCSAGVCTCNNGYSGSDCSIAPTAVPSILVEQSNSLCASNFAGTCNRSVLHGENFLSTTKIQLKPITITQDGITAYGDAIVVDAIYRSKYQVLANMEQQQSYQIKVSNTEAFNANSVPAYMVIYNSVCESCDFTGANGVPICIQKVNTCFINDKCYSEGDENPGNSCQACDSTALPTGWTNTTDSNCIPATTVATTPTVPTIPTTSSSTTKPITPSPDAVEFNSRTVIIVAACVAALLLIIIVVAITIIVVRRKRARENANRLRDDSSDGGSHSHFERVFNGSYGLRTDKSLTFYNPSNQSDMNSRIYPTLYDNANYNI